MESIIINVCDRFRREPRPAITVPQFQYMFLLRNIAFIARRVLGVLKIGPDFWDDS